MGLLTNRGPPSWHPASDELKVRMKIFFKKNICIGAWQALCARAGAYCAAEGVELGKLSVHHNLVSLGDSVACTLLGVGKLDILRINLDLVFRGLTDKEAGVLEAVKEKFFSGLGSVAWDSGIWDLDVYNQAVKK